MFSEDKNPLVRVHAGRALERFQKPAISPDEYSPLVKGATKVLFKTKLNDLGEQENLKVIRALGLWAEAIPAEEIDEIVGRLLHILNEEVIPKTKAQVIETLGYLMSVISQERFGDVIGELLESLSSVNSTQEACIAVVDTLVHIAKAVPSKREEIVHVLQTVRPAGDFTCRNNSP